MQGQETPTLIKSYSRLSKQFNQKITNHIMSLYSNNLSENAGINFLSKFRKATFNLLFNLNWPFYKYYTQVASILD